MRIFTAMFSNVSAVATRSGMVSFERASNTSGLAVTRAANWFIVMGGTISILYDAGFGGVVLQGFQHHTCKMVAERVRQIGGEAPLTRGNVLTSYEH